MKNFLFYVIGILIACNIAYSQQTPFFSEYYYNQVLLNPAHAGYSKNSELNLSNSGYINRFEGSPRTISGTYNTSFNKQKHGLAVGAVSDQIGVTDLTSAFVSYAYKIHFGHNYNRAKWWDYNPDVLSFGITTGLIFINEDLASLNIQNDPNFQSNINTRVPIFGFGAMYNHNNMYLGLAIQNLFANTFTNDNISLDVPVYFYGGYNFYTNLFQKIRIQPNVLAKYVEGTPVQFDFNVSGNYKNKIEVGAGYRTTSSINLLLGLFVNENLRIAYNYTSFLDASPLSNNHGFILTYRAGEGFGSKSTL